MIVKALRDFCLVVALQTRQAMYHRKEALGVVVTWGLRLGVTILLYKGIYNLLDRPVIKGIDLKTAVSSMILYTIFGGFGVRDMFRLIDREYKSGMIEVWLNKPISYLMLKTGENLGKSIPSAIGLAVAGIVFWCMGDLAPDVPLFAWRVLWCCLLTALGLVVGYLLYVIIGLTSVFLQDAQAVFLINDKLLMTFGGIYIPIGFFPHSFRLFGETLPTGAAVYMTQAFYPDFFNNLPRFLITQCIWIVLLWLCLRAMNSAMDKKMTVNGG